MAAPAPYLVEEILEEILIRLPTPAALARASIACVSFRRIITARSFLRRYRKLHPPPLLGFAAENGGFDPVQEPHPSAPLAHALADAADFSYSYVPKPDEFVNSAWSPCDVRDGRVLLLCNRWFHRTKPAILRKALAVCDPLSRRYVLLPPLPLDMDMTMLQEHLLGYEPILAPAGDDEDETSFRVLCWASYRSKFFMLVFSSATGKWCMAASPSWSSFGTVESSEKSMLLFKYIRGCLYWRAPVGDKLLLLDTCSMEFSTVNILTSCHMQLINLLDQSRWSSSLVLATEGALEMFTLIRNCLNDSYSIYHTIQQNGSHYSGNCDLKNVIELPRSYWYFIAGATGGFLFLRGIRESQSQASQADIEDLFSLDIKTSELKMVHGGAQNSHNLVRPAQPYFGFPPSLSKPSL
ncbi:uncharacterized protein [Lolium perenne]|uniref:uncharacterized protein n=1 Tax=Lolium perenne TaxID=4522 RepID=UPI0021EA2D52|nr:uncharacterized protein LOC127308467 [Lolium perenne]XP_051195256.1 uncharacterized protein LOC127308467 [Lolium perenne]